MNVLRHRDFRLLFLGQTASAIGDQLVLVALALFVARLTDSAVDVGITLAAGVVPFVTFLLVGGVWADRLPRHRIMLATDVARGVLHALLAGLILARVVRVWEIAVIEFAFGTARAFFQPAYTGLMPQTVPEGAIAQARALTESMYNVASLAGPALATALVLGLGAGVAFAFDAFTFLLSAGLLARMRPRPRGDAPERASVLAELRDGWSEVRSRVWVWATIASFSGFLLTVSGPWQALGPIIARRHYGSVGIYGILMVVRGAGSVLGSIVAIRWRPRRALGTGMLLVLAAPLPGGLLALGAPVALVAAGAALSGFGFALLLVWWEISLVRHIPPHALSRVSAWDWMGALALLPVGLLAAGPLGELLGARLVLGVGSLLGLACLLGGALPRQTRRLEWPAAGAGAAAGVTVVLVSLGMAVGMLGAAGPARAAGLRHPPMAGLRHPLTLEWVGDMAMSTQLGLPPGGVPGALGPDLGLLREADITLGNLEGTLSTSGPSKCGSGAGGGTCFAFQAPPSYAFGLHAAGFDLVNQANNHSMDFGATGRAQTVAALDAAGVAHTGFPGQITVLHRDGTSVAFLGFAPYPFDAELLDIPGMESLVRRAHRIAPIVVVIIHAGAEGAGRLHTPAGTETYLGEDRGDSRAFAHAAIRAGASLVVGSGPHVIRGIERYRNRMIAYSLGNFIGYRTLGGGGTLDQSGILRVALDERGRVVGGRWISIVLRGGLPYPDPVNGSAHLVAALSAADFPARYPIDGAGRFRVPPERGVAVGRPGGV